MNEFQILLTFLNQSGRWRVSSPNGHYRECSHVAHLAETVSKIVEDYAEYLKEMTNLDHLEIKIERK